MKSSATAPRDADVAVTLGSQNREATFKYFNTAEIQNSIQDSGFFFFVFSVIVVSLSLGREKVCYAM